MSVIKIYRIWIIGVILMILPSCGKQPDADFLLGPEFRIVSAEVDGRVVSLLAGMQAHSKGITECGFYYGYSEDSMVKKVSKYSYADGVFRSVLSNLEYNTEYLYKAYVSNGHNTIYSNVKRFRTAECFTQEEPEEPKDPDGSIEQDDPDTPDEMIVPDAVMDISYGLDFFVIYPPMLEKPEVECLVDPYGSWLTLGHAINGNAFIQALANESDTDSRYEILRFSTDEDVWLLKVVQHARREPIDFKCPVMKEQCVAMWDGNGDGELSYEEAASVTMMVKQSFARRDFTSFDELRFFANAFPSYSLPGCVFEGCDNLESISFPVSDMADMGRGICKDCHGLKRFQAEGNNISDEAFMNCTSLLLADGNITGESAFMGCTGLIRAIQRGNGIPARTFKDCRNLQTFALIETDDNGLYIGREAFYGCSSLRETSTLFGIAEISDMAFYGCSSLEAVDMPRSVNYIGEKAFYGCSSLNTVHIAAISPPVLGDDAFEGVSPDIKFYVPSVLVDVYKSEWPEFADHIFAAE